VSRAEAYERAAAALLASSGCTVRRYRTKTTGTAYTTSDDWGIEVPRPRGPVSFAVFAHEVAHQLLHRSNSKPRWLEEIEAWEFALDCFPRFELSGVERARRDAARSLRYAFLKAGRRAKPETVATMVERFPRWVWNEGGPPVFFAGGPD
jgi:hypothetical protein